MSTKRRPPGTSQGGQYAPSARATEQSLASELKLPSEDQPTMRYRSAGGLDLVKSGSYDERRRISKDKRAGAYNLSQLARDPRSRQERTVRREEMAYGPRPIGTGRYYDAKVVSDLRLNIPNNPGVTPAISRSLADTPHDDLTRAVLRGRYTDNGTKNHIALTAKKDSIRAEAAGMDGMEPATIVRLAADDSASVVERVARRKDIPAEAEPTLASHASPYVRQAFARRAKTHRVLSDLSNDPVNRVRRRASKRLRKLF